MKPTVGRIVLYNVRDDDDPALTHNQAFELPAIVVRVWGANCVNLQILLDGPGSSVWKTSVIEGTEPGNWHWPKKP